MVLSVGGRTAWCLVLCGLLEALPVAFVCVLFGSWLILDRLSASQKLCPWHCIALFGRVCETGVFRIHSPSLPT